MKRILSIFLLLTIFYFQLYSQEDITKRVEKLEKIVDDLKQSDQTETLKNKDNIYLQKDQWGKGLSFEIFGGMQGVYSRGGIGINTPKIANCISFGFGFIFQSDMINDIFIEKSIKVNSIIPSGYLNFKWSSPLFFNFTRLYGVVEAVVGYNIGTTYDIGKNLALNISSYGGVELYSIKIMALFIEGGGGFFRTFSFENNEYLNKNSWLGSGFGLRFGTRFFINKK